MRLAGWLAGGAGGEREADGNGNSLLRSGMKAICEMGVDV